MRFLVGSFTKVQSEGKCSRVVNGGISITDKNGFGRVLLNINPNLIVYPGGKSCSLLRYNSFNAKTVTGQTTFLDVDSTICGVWSPDFKNLKDILTEDPAISSAQAVHPELQTGTSALATSQPNVLPPPALSSTLKSPELSDCNQRRCDKRRKLRRGCPSL